MKFKRGDKLPKDYHPEEDANGVLPPFKVGSFYETASGHVVQCISSDGHGRHDSEGYGFIWQWNIPGYGGWFDEGNGKAPLSCSEMSPFWPLAGEVDKDGNPLPDEYAAEPEDPEVVLESRKRTIQMLLQMTLEQCGKRIGARDMSEEMAEILAGQAGEVLLQAVQNAPKKTVTQKKATRKKAVKKAAKKKSSRVT